MRRRKTTNMITLATPKRTSRSQNTGNSAVTSFMTKNEKPHASAQHTINSLLNHSASRRRPELPCPMRYTRSKATKLGSSSAAALTSCTTLEPVNPST